MRGRAPLFCLACLVPTTLAAQARIDAIIPTDARVAVHRLGFQAPEVAVAGMELAPGDLLDAGEEGVAVGLTCSAPEGTNTYLVTGPFRLLVDVPTVASCHVNLLAGLTEVVAEAPTETTAGGVTLGSTGTQYAVELRRSGRALVFACFVYDDSIRVLGTPGLIAAAGQKMVWADLRSVSVQANTSRDLARSATTYARFDLAQATARGAAAEEDSAAMLRTLSALHMEVLAHPSDTARRVALAKEQIRWDVRDRAMYNLKRVDLRDAASLQRYQIDPSMVGERVPGSVVRPATPATEVRARPDARLAGEVDAATPTVDMDLRLIDAGRVDEAIRNLEARVASGRATSRDHYALARAWGLGGSDEHVRDRVRAHVARALVLHARDGALSVAELEEMGELIGRLD
jgi:hypothetical protein